MNYLRWVLLLTVLICPCLVTANETEPGFDAFWRGDLKAALKIFKEETEAQPNKYSAWYNFGTVAAKLGEIGPAVYGLERALRLRPNSPDAITNLTLVKKLSVEAFANKDSDEAVILPALDQSGTSLFRLYQPRTMNLVFGACWGLFLIALLVARRGRASRVRTTGFFFALVFFLLSMGVGTLRLGRGYWVDRVKQGVVVETSVLAKQGPGDQYRKVSRILGGVTVDVLGEQDGWTLTEFGNGRTGWLKSTALLALPTSD